MSDTPERFLAESRELIASGNRLATVFLLGTLAWWVGNLLPYNFAETGTGTLAAKLGKLDRLTKQAIRRCQSLRYRYINTLLDAQLDPKSKCPLSWPALPVTLEGLSKTTDKSSLPSRGEMYARLTDAFRDAGEKETISEIKKSVDSTLSTNRSTSKGACTSVKEVKKALNDCEKSAGAIVTFNESMSRQSNLDVGGIKLTNIHPRWHAAVLLLILTVGTIWLATYRRRAFHLLAQYISYRLRSSRGRNMKKLTEPVLLTLPWWLLGGPMSSERTRPFYACLSPKREHVGARLVLCFIGFLVFVFFFSAIQTQTLLTSFTRADLTALTAFEIHSFSLTGLQPVDLMLISGVFFCSIAYFWWIVPPDISGWRDNLEGSDRREFVRGAAAATGVLFATTAMPFAAAPESSITLKDKISWKVGFPINPRYHRKPRYRYRFVKLDSGWYRLKKNAQIDRGAPGKVHYVCPAYRFESRPSARPKEPAHRKRRRIVAIMRDGLLRPINRSKRRLTKSITYDAGRIKGGWKINSRYLKKLSDDDMLPTNSQLQAHLSRRAYSEGIETTALNLWQQDKHDRALAVLRVGLTYTGEVGTLNLRLYDLLAGLLIRAGRASEIAPLIETLTTAQRYLDKTISDLSGQVAKLNEMSMRPRIVLPQATDGEFRKKDKRQREKTKLTRPQAEAVRLNERKEKFVAQRRHLQNRIVKWSKVDGVWARKWRAGVPRRWASIDIRG